MNTGAASTMRLTDGILVTALLVTLGMIDEWEWLRKVWVWPVIYWIILFLIENANRHSVFNLMVFPADQLVYRLWPIFGLPWDSDILNLSCLIFVNIFWGVVLFCIGYVLWKKVFPRIFAPLRDNVFPSYYTSLTPNHLRALALLMLNTIIVIRIGLMGAFKFVPRAYSPENIFHDCSVAANQVSTFIFLAGLAGGSIALLPWRFKSVLLFSVNCGCGILGAVAIFLIGPVF
jgi:hypothetical protein